MVIVNRVPDGAGDGQREGCVEDGVGGRGAYFVGAAGDRLAIDGRTAGGQFNQRAVAGRASSRRNGQPGQFSVHRLTGGQVVGFAVPDFVHRIARACCVAGGGDIIVTERALHIIGLVGAVRATTRVGNQRGTGAGAGIKVEEVEVSRRLRAIAAVRRNPAAGVQHNGLIVGRIDREIHALLINQIEVVV